MSRKQYFHYFSEKTPKRMVLAVCSYSRHFQWAYVATGCMPAGNEGGDELFLCCVSVTARSFGERAIRLLRLNWSSSIACILFVVLSTLFLVGGVVLLSVAFVGIMVL
uniref:Uncharacterized protein n=1 Tax=Glossina brevipalpis TaxID=37001 RepID=A0A1A9WAP4_9MUSC